MLFVQIRQKPPFGFVVGVRDVVAAHRFFARHLTSFCYKNSSMLKFPVQTEFLISHKKFEPQRLFNEWKVLTGQMLDLIKSQKKTTAAGSVNTRQPSFFLNHL